MQRTQRQEAFGNPDLTFWKSDFYFNMLFSEKPNRFRKEESRALATDLLTALHENGWLSKRSYGEYTDRGVSTEPERKQNKITSQYAQTTLEHCKNFEKALEKENLSIVRASLETWIAKCLETFLNDPNIPVGSIFVVFSPRGGGENDSINEKYPGLSLENPNLITIYRKRNQKSTNQRASCLFDQYVSFVSTKDLAKLQQKIRQKIPQAQEYKPIPYPTAFVESTTNTQKLPTHAEHTLISKPLIITDFSDAAHSAYSSTNTALFTQLENIIHYHEEKYTNTIDNPITVNELPKIKQELFDTEAIPIVNVCVQAFHELAYEVQSGVISQEEAIQEYDDLIALMRIYLLGWVASIENKNQSKDANTLSIQKTFSIWKIKQKKKRGKTPLTDLESLTEKDTTNQLQNALGILARLTAIGHCVGFSPVSVLSSIKTSTTAFSSPPSIATNLFGTSFAIDYSQSKKNRNMGGKTEQQEFISEHNQELIDLYTIINSVTPITVDNWETGEKETIYVCFSNSSLKAEYEPGCYKKTSKGAVYGPCDIELEKDSLLLHIPQLPTHIKKSKTSKHLCESEYQAILNRIAVLEILQLESMFTNTEDKSQDQSGEAQQVLTAISQELSKKMFIISFSDFIAGTISTTQEYEQLILLLPQKIKYFLAKHPGNKLSALTRVLALLKKTDLYDFVQKLNQNESLHISKNISQTIFSQSSPKLVQ